MEAHVYKDTSWRMGIIEDIIKETKTIDDLALVRLLDCAKAFAARSAKEKVIFATIEEKGGLEGLTAGDITEMSQKLQLSPAQVWYYFFPNFERN